MNSLDDGTPVSTLLDSDETAHTISEQWESMAMKIVYQDADEATITLTKEEVGIIGLVGIEFTTGPCAPDEEMWADMMPSSRDSVATLFESLPTFE